MDGALDALRDEGDASGRLALIRSTGPPSGRRRTVREVRSAVGAGSLYAICGDMRTMPGLGRHPAAERIDIDDNGETIGLF